MAHKKSSTRKKKQRKLARIRNRKREEFLARCRGRIAKAIARSTPFIDILKNGDRKIS